MSDKKCPKCKGHGGFSYLLDGERRTHECQKCNGTGKVEETKKDANRKVKE